jgi:hypothetical protein
VDPRIRLCSAARTTAKQVRDQWARSLGDALETRDMLNRIRQATEDQGTLTADHSQQTPRGATPPLRMGSPQLANYVPKNPVQDPLLPLPKAD